MNRSRTSGRYGPTYGHVICAGHPVTRDAVLRRQIPAQIDGASRWTTFRKVTLPQLRPTTFFLSITVMLNSLQVFDIIYVMTRGGPQGNGTTTMVFQVYQETFVNYRAGYGATVATIMFLILLIITVLQVRSMDRGNTK